jgi:hypothetical protein
MLVNQRRNACLNGRQMQAAYAAIINKFNDEAEPQAKVLGAMELDGYRKTGPGRLVFCGTSCSAFRQLITPQVFYEINCVRPYAQISVFYVKVSGRILVSGYH